MNSIAHSSGWHSSRQDRLLARADDARSIAAGGLMAACSSTTSRSLLFWATLASFQGCRASVCGRLLFCTRPWQSGVSPVLRIARGCENATPNSRYMRTETNETNERFDDPG